MNFWILSIFDHFTQFLDFWVFIDFWIFWISLDILDFFWIFWTQDIRHEDFRHPDFGLCHAHIGKLGGKHFFSLFFRQKKFQTKQKNEKKWIFKIFLDFLGFSDLLTNIGIFFISGVYYVFFFLFLFYIFRFFGRMASLRLKENFELRKDIRKQGQGNQCQTFGV